MVLKSVSRKLQAGNINRITALMFILGTCNRNNVISDIIIIA